MPTPKDLSKEALIPKPVTLTAHGSSFALNASSSIYVEEGNEELLKIGQYLAEKLRPATSFNLEVLSTTERPSAGNIYLHLNGEDSELGEEGYALSLT